ASRERTAAATTGVGTGAPGTTTTKPAAANTAAATSTNCADPWRASPPTTTVDPGGSCSRRWRATAVATSSTVPAFIRPGPSPSGARTPAVPKRSGGTVVPGGGSWGAVTG